MAKSKAVLIFEAVAHAVRPLPGRTSADAIADRTAMIGPGGALVSWDWQLVEIEAASRGLAVHPNGVAVFDKGSAQPDRWLPYDGDEDLYGTVRAALGLLGVRAGG